MPYMIDAHLDLAYNALTFGRNYLRSAVETRQLEQDTPTVERTGHTLLGWEDLQRGQVAVVFGTLFLAPQRYQGGTWETQVFRDAATAHHLYEKQLDYYRRLTGDHPEKFRLVTNKKDLGEVLAAWEQSPASLPKPSEGEEEPKAAVTHPVGVVLLMEGAEGIHAPEEMEEWWEQGVRLAGPVWAGTRFCGGMIEPGDFSSEGYALLEVMADLGYTLDISHMNDVSAQQALDRYAGPVVATHANVRALIKDAEGERHLSDRVIRKLIERDGVMGVIPYNRFLIRSWTKTDDRQAVTLRTLAAHIDHICQLAGNAQHAAIGTDFDGGYGWPYVPAEINTIADMQKLAGVLAEDFGYAQEAVDAIMGGNWRRHLERTLPES